MTKICIFGDSQTAGVTGSSASATTGTLDRQGVARKLRYQGDFDIENLAVISTQLDDALGYWNALTSERQAEFDYVFIGGFNNNLNAGGSVVANYIIEAQALVDQVRADNATCRIIMSTCIPVLNYWEDTIFPGDPASAAEYHQNWLDVNEALQGLGGNAIEGTDGCATEHTDYLNDGSDSLQSIYANGSDTLHTNEAGQDVIADSWLRLIS